MTDASGSDASDGERDRILVRRALNLALKGRGHVEPNPCVGALALLDGEVVGEGFHRAYGEAHAEREALRDALDNGLVPDELVVTMEPCSTKKGVDGKKTDPCTEAILKTGIRRVIIGGGDPDPRHDGPGVRALREHGIEVVTGVLDEECRAINRPFERWLGLDRPWIVFKSAQTLDGKIATRTGDSRWISSEESRFEVHELRARCDAVLVGFRTALTDDPKLTVRLPDGHRLVDRRPLRIVVDPRAELGHDRFLVRTANDHPTCFLVREDAERGRVESLMAAGVDVRRVPPGDGKRSIDLVAGFRALRLGGVKKLLLEGGGALAAACFDQDLIDQWRIYLAPLVVGGQEAPTAVGGLGVERLGEAIRMRSSAVRRSGPDLVIDSFV